jgi:hypothetical protein
MLCGSSPAQLLHFRRCAVCRVPVFLSETCKAAYCLLGGVEMAFGVPTGCFVAQVFNLLYRRFSIGMPHDCLTLSKAVEAF